MMTASSGRRHPFFDKLNSVQLSQYLTYQREEERDEYRMRSSNRWFSLSMRCLESRSSSS